MSEADKILESIKQGEPLTVREVELILRHWGYVKRPGKGSHQNWKHPTKPKILTIAVHGKDLPRYITRALKKIMEEDK